MKPAKGMTVAKLFKRNKHGAKLRSEIPGRWRFSIGLNPTKSN
jgi:hypothetical protein